TAAGTHRTDCLVDKTVRCDVEGDRFTSLIAGHVHPQWQTAANWNSARCVVRPIQACYADRERVGGIGDRAARGDGVVTGARDKGLRRRGELAVRVSGRVEVREGPGGDVHRLVRTEAAAAEGQCWRRTVEHLGRTDDQSRRSRGNLERDGDL